MPFIEAPTTFYLGRRFDPTTRRLIDEVVYYDSRDLTTHAVVVGMTGSGKTGLCITLLEEAVMDNIPSIIIDPKGDITNLMLPFQRCAGGLCALDQRRRRARAGQEIDDTRRKSRSNGATAWQAGGHAASLARLKDNARFSIYHAGSDTGLPVSILDAMHAPPDGFQPTRSCTASRSAASSPRCWR